MTDLSVLTGDAAGGRDRWAVPFLPPCFGWPDVDASTRLTNDPTSRQRPLLLKHLLVPRERRMVSKSWVTTATTATDTTRLGRLDLCI